MLELVVRFEDSWTNCFYENKGENPLFNSLDDIKQSLRNIVPLTIFTSDNSHGNERLAYLQALQQKNPGMKYRVPENFDRTCRGVLARLTGEVRRLSAIEDDPSHLVNRVFDNGSYKVQIESLDSHTTTLLKHTVGDNPSSGAGVFDEGITNALYSNSHSAKYLFGHLGMSLDEMTENIDEIFSSDYCGEWYPKSPDDLIGTINNFAKQQEKIVKKATDDKLPNPYLNALEKFSQLLNIPLECSEKWKIAGGICAIKAHLLNEQDRVAFIETRALTKNGNIAGITSVEWTEGGDLKNIGHLTSKGVIAHGTGKKAQAWRFPYGHGLNIPVNTANGITAYVPTGILKKSGTFTFTMDNNPELEEELNRAIDGAAVGPLHFGKKGIAYVTSFVQY